MEAVAGSAPSDIIKTIGEPIQLVTSKLIHGEKRFVYNVNSLEEILCHPLMSTKHLSVISIIGPGRKGKSFLLNILLRYIFSKYNPSWLSNLDQPLDGFTWNCGINSNTAGIVLWNEPFLTRIDGEERVLLVMDVQGIFNKLSSLNECTKLSAFSLLLSSHLLVNISDSFDEMIYDFAELFINYATLIIGSWCTVKPFQNIIAIIRDWAFPNEFPYGLHGGDLYMKYSMKTGSSPKLNRVPSHISYFAKDNSSRPANIENAYFKQYYKNVFSSIQCFLLPHPGHKVSMNSNFDGRMRDINPAFLEHMKALILSILSSENLQLKKINGHFLTCKEYFQYFKSLIHIMESDDFPQIQNILSENASFNQSEFVENMKELYITSIDKIITSEECYVSDEKLNLEHVNILKIIQSQLETAKMFYKSQTIESSNAMIEKSLYDIQMKYKSDNNNKNLNMSIFTPYSLIIVLTLTYLLYHLMNIIKIKFVSMVTEIIFYGALTINLLWIAACFWEIEFISAMFDQLTDLLIFFVHDILEQPSLSVYTYTLDKSYTESFCFSFINNHPFLRWLFSRFCPTETGVTIWSAKNINMKIIELKKESKVFKPVIGIMKNKPVKILNPFYQNFSKKSVNFIGENSY